MWRRRTACIAIVALATIVHAHAQPASPTTAPDRAAPDKVSAAPSAADQQRLSDLVALIDGQNSPAARLTGARELLRIGAPDAAKRLAGVLGGANRPAKIAVATALAETTTIDAAFLAPLVSLLADDEADVRLAAAAALAKGGTPAIARLSELLNEPQASQTAKLAAIDSLGRMTQRDAIALLVAALADPASPLCRSALEALERATAQDFAGDLAAAQRWWEETRGVDPTVWHQIQIDRLVRQSGQLGQRVRELETRLSTTLREHFFRTPEAERAAVLNGYLSDASDVVRLLGLDLVQSQITEGKPPSADTTAKARELFAAAEPRIRAAAIRTVASLRDRTDADRFAQRLAAELDPVVRIAIIYGLGYVGGPESVAIVLATLSDADAATSDEAITALGRIAERPGLDVAARERIATALLDRWTSGGSTAASRERLVRAMSRVADRRFAAIFVESLAITEPTAVRLAAVRGLSVLVDPRVEEASGTSASAPTSENSDAARKPLIDALHRAVADGDASVRKAAVEAIGGLATNENHLAVLWTRLAAAQEPDETVRTLAWRGALRMLTGRPIAEIEAAIERLPENGAARATRAIELLQLAEKQAVAAGVARGELGRIRARIAALRAQSNQPAEAIAAYGAAIEDLAAANSPDARKTLVELLRFAIACEKCDVALPRLTKLAGDYSAVWIEIRDELQALIRRETLEKALAALVALHANNPPALGAEARLEVDQWLTRARELRTEGDAQQVAAAIATLQANPADEAARSSIAQLGPRAVPGIRAALRDTLSADSANPALERALHDLLRLCLPDWPGFAPDASIADKIKALDRISA